MGNAPGTVYFPANIGNAPKTVYFPAKKEEMYTAYESHCFETVYFLQEYRGKYTVYCQMCFLGWNSIHRFNNLVSMN